MLTSHKLFFTTEVEDAELRKGDEEEEGTENGVSKADFHLKAKWFHGKLTSRDEARRLLEIGRAHV